MERPLLEEESSATREEEAKDVEQQKQQHGGAGVSSATANLSNTIIGAGMMGLPFTFKVLGEPLGVLLLLVMAVLTRYSIRKMIECSEWVRVRTYGDLMEAAYGRWAQQLLRWTIVVQNTCMLVVYVIIIADVMSGSGAIGSSAHHMGLLEQLVGGPTWWNSRFTITLVTILLIIFPLSCFKNVDSLHTSSAVSIGLTLVFVLVLIILVLALLVKGGVSAMAPIKWLPVLGTSSEVWDVFGAVPMMATAYVCHYNIHPIYAELEPPKPQKMMTAVNISIVLTMAVYCITAIFGLALFGEAVLGDVLANFDQDLGVPYWQFASFLVRASYAVHLMLVFPVVQFSFRLVLDSLIFPESLTPITEDSRRFMILTVGPLLVIMVGALTIPGIEVVLKFAGSFASASLAFTYPGLVCLSSSLSGALSGPRERSFALGMFVFGLFISVTGLASQLVKALRL